MDQSEVERRMDKLVAPLVKTFGSDPEEAKARLQEFTSGREIELTQYPGDREQIEPGGPSMSNFDHKIGTGLEDELRAGRIGEHAAWDFYAYLWHDDGLFYENVWQHHEPVATFAADSLEALMKVVNDEYGWE